MNLELDSTHIAAFTSGSQRARVLTEAWVESGMYCAGCASNKLIRMPNNAQAIDFKCSSCQEPYQLKSGKLLPKKRIVDAAYSSMVSAIRRDRTPNLLYLHYAPFTEVLNLLLIPRFAFGETCIEARRPLASTARRAGWIGCNIRLDLIPSEGRITVVEWRKANTPQHVRTSFEKIRALAAVPPNIRGWTLALLQLLDRFGARDFTLQEAYALEPALQERYPLNKHIKPKIRQQLQVLRDAGILIFLGNGRYSRPAPLPPASLDR